MGIRAKSSYELMLLQLTTIEAFHTDLDYNTAYRAKKSKDCEKRKRSLTRRSRYAVVNLFVLTCSHRI